MLRMLYSKGRRGETNSSAGLIGNDSRQRIQLREFIATLVHWRCLMWSLSLKIVMGGLGRWSGEHCRNSVGRNCKHIQLLKLAGSPASRKLELYGNIRVYTISCEAPAKIPVLP